jgi:hypothetical protein
MEKTGHTFCLLVLGAVLLAGCMEAAPAKVHPVTPAAGESDSVSGTIPLSGTLPDSPDFSTHFQATEILTRPTDHSVTVSIVPEEDVSIFFAYGGSSGSPSCRTAAVPGQAGEPLNITITGLLPDSSCAYRTCIEAHGTTGLTCGPEHPFHTQRSPGSTFTFGIQADSHPERPGTMFDSALYEQTLRNVAEDRPDFYLTLGDDFSIDRLIEKGQLSQDSVDRVYLNQRGYLGAVGSSSPLFLVNGNHEEAARYLLDGTPDNAAVYAGRARMQYFPQPVPDGFYTGDGEPVEYVGLPGDSYAWQWGDALFVVIDPYWHSTVAVDNIIGQNSGKKRDPWDVTLGEAQYRWLRETLEGSNATYKFVFAHHAGGTGRGGIEVARLAEWGGRNRMGTWEFNARRPGWEAPIRQLMAENGVTIFFQGHDHLFARQELDGVIYQEVPCPADPTYSTFNADAYASGVKLPNAGYLRVTVSPQQATVGYVRTFLPGEETASEKNGMVAYSYTVPAAPRGRAGP